MNPFEIDSSELYRQSENARQRARAGDGVRLAGRLRADEPLTAEELAVIFLSREVGTEDLLNIARQRRSPSSVEIETFCPLYISNECDAECLMCGMQRFNQNLVRETADESTVKEQLEVLSGRGIRGVALLTGEYQAGPRRREMLARTASALRESIARGFGHVLINVGSIEDDEYPELLFDVPRTDDDSILPHVTMCTFQETYDPAIYKKFMGSNATNPRSNFERRLKNFDRASEAGFRSANPGVLVGLNRDLAYEILAMVRHVRHLLDLNMQVYVSLPRLRKANGATHTAGVADDEFCRMVAVLSAGLADAKVVISTRESPEIQQRLLRLIGVLTPGSPGVAPYTKVNARFESHASQFEVADHRPFEEILGECMNAGATIQGYEPVQASVPPGE